MPAPGYLQIGSAFKDLFHALSQFCFVFHALSSPLFIYFYLSTLFFFFFLSHGDGKCLKGATGSEITKL